MAVKSQPLTTPKVKSNGHRPEPFPTRSIRIGLSGRYEGFWFEADPEPSIGQLNRMGQEKAEVSIAILTELVTDWNYTDKVGQPIPPLSDPTCWETLSPQLLRSTLLAYLDAVKTDVALPLVSPRP